jgi:hypothetical protein
MHQIEHDRQEALYGVLGRRWPGGMIDRQRGYIKNTTPAAPMTRFPSVVEGQMVFIPSHPDLGAGLLTKVWMMVEGRCPKTQEITRVSWNGLVVYGRVWLVANIMMLQPFKLEVPNV